MQSVQHYVMTSRAVWTGSTSSRRRERTGSATPPGKPTPITLSVMPSRLRVRFDDGVADV